MGFLFSINYKNYKAKYTNANCVSGFVFTINYTFKNKIL